MKKKYLVAIIVWMFLFAGCSEGNRRHRGHHGYRRPVRPYHKQVRLPVRHRGPKIAVRSHSTYTMRKGLYGSRRGLRGQTRGKGHGKGK